MLCCWFAIFILAFSYISRAVLFTPLGFGRRLGQSSSFSTTIRLKLRLVLLVGGNWDEVGEVNSGLDNFACSCVVTWNFFGGGNKLLLSDSQIGRRKMTATRRHWFALQGEVVW